MSESNYVIGNDNAYFDSIRQQGGVADWTQAGLFEPVQSPQAFPGTNDFNDANIIPLGLGLGNKIGAIKDGNGNAWIFDTYYGSWINQGKGGELPTSVSYSVGRSDPGANVNATRRQKIGLLKKKK